MDLFLLNASPSDNILQPNERNLKSVLLIKYKIKVGYIQAATRANYELRRVCASDQILLLLCLFLGFTKFRYAVN